MKDKDTQMLSEAYASMLTDDYKSFRAARDREAQDSLRSISTGKMPKHLQPSPQKRDYEAEERERERKNVIIDPLVLAASSKDNDVVEQLISRYMSEIHDVSPDKLDPRFMNDWIEEIGGLMHGYSPAGDIRDFLDNIGNNLKG